jgi:CTP:molybdopterin cytidylyltransferase MocA/ubiquinone/menaquinone biosynthesis C-methylase UbiE
VSGDRARRIGAVVLAAGAGSRFGGGKLLAPLQGRPILQHVLDRLAASGLEDMVVVVGEDALDLERAIEWHGARRVRNPDPGRGLSSSLQHGIGALAPGVDAALIVLGDQPRLPARAIRALLDARPDDTRPIVVPVYGGDAGRNPVLIGRAAFGLVDQATGDRGLGPLLDANRDLVQEIPIRVDGGNPDVDTRADLIGLLEHSWAQRVVANAEQVDRFREVPDGADFYAPVTGLFRADPRRTDEPVLDALLRLVEPGETWIDIGAGAGRYALPIALALAPSGGRVIALDASPGMLDALLELQSEHGVTDVEVVETRWPPTDGTAMERFQADVALIAHVGYDIESIGPFVRAMESVARRLCVAVLMERQPASVADVCWPPVHGEARVALPALPDFVELLQARGHEPSVEMLQREPRRFASRDEIEGFLRRQLWIEPGGAADARFQGALDELLVVDADGGVGLRGQQPLPIGVVTWDPRAAVG